MHRGCNGTVTGSGSSGSHSPGVSEASFGARTESAVGRGRLLLPMGKGSRAIETRGSTISLPPWDRKSWSRLSDKPPPHFRVRSADTPNPGTSPGFPRAPTPPLHQSSTRSSGDPVLTRRQASSLRPLILLLSRRKSFTSARGLASQASRLPAGLPRDPLHQPGASLAGSKFSGQGRARLV